MSYISFFFLIFVGITGAIYFVAPKKMRWVVLLIASLVFYWINSQALVIFLLAATLILYFSAIKLSQLEQAWKTEKATLEKSQIKAQKQKHKGRKKLVVTLAVVSVFAILIVLKYSAFFLGKSVHLFGVSEKIFTALVPLGISYYTLQGASYIIDVYRGKIKAERNFAKLTLFMSFFPQIVEGPIGRYDLLAPQLFAGNSFDYDRFRSGGLLMVWGFFKKMVIADRVALLVNTVFKEYGNYSGAIIALSAFLYTIQIYAEFSGCIDIVTGVSEIFGVKLSSNFQRPFFSKSIAEFWRRWHITLGTWLKDYVFYSFSLSKGFGKASKACRTKLKPYLAAFVPTAMALLPVWLFNGFWHGASWKYVCYGLYYYFIMMLGLLCQAPCDKLIQKLKINKKSKPYCLFQIIRTTLIVCVGMLLFRASSLGDAVMMLGRIFTNFSFTSIIDGSMLNLGMDIKDFIVILIGVIIMFVFGLLQENGKAIRPIITRQKLPVRWAIYIVAIFSLIILGVYSSSFNAGQFIYGQF